MPISHLLHLASSNEISKAIISLTNNIVTYSVTTPSSTSSSFNFNAYLPASLTPSIIKSLSNVPILQISKPPVSSKISSTLLIALPFIYLGLMYKMMKNLYSDVDGKDGDGVSKKRNKSSASVSTTFSDIAGVDDVKAQLTDIVDCIRSPRAYRAMGAKLPKGVLLQGPPGSGKTLLARAIAGEGSCAFMSCSASDFVEMFSGRGAARVRELFCQARKEAITTKSKTCIIFIDEIDALAKRRGGFGGNDEREQTLNQLLCEMDGFDYDENTEGCFVLVLAATNRVEILDEALVRPGRFDRIVHTHNPEKAKDREAILKLHARKIICRTGFDWEMVSSLDEVENSSGADLANIVNEGALIAVRNRRAAMREADVVQAARNQFESRLLN